MRRRVNHVKPSPKNTDDTVSSNWFQFMEQQKSQLKIWRRILIQNEEWIRINSGRQMLDGQGAWSQDTCTCIRELSASLCNRICCDRWSNDHVWFLVSISTASEKTNKNTFHLSWMHFWVKSDFSLKAKVQRLNFCPCWIDQNALRFLLKMCSFTGLFCSWNANDKVL